MKKALPSIEAPRILTTLPVSKKKIKFRPFVNREKKVLLLSKESDDWDSTLETLADVISACTFGEVDINEVPMTDVAYLFVKMRINAMGNIIPITTKCKKCDYEIQLNYNMDDAKVTDDWQENLKLQGIMLSLRAPTLRDMKILEQDEELFIASLVTGICSEEEVYDLGEYTTEEIKDWLNTLPDSEVKKLNLHLNTLPKLKQDVSYACPKCGHIHEVKLEGLSDFF